MRLRPENRAALRELLAEVEPRDERGSGEYTPGFDTGSISELDAIVLILAAQANEPRDPVAAADQPPAA